MNLRTRLLFGYWYLVGLLVIAAATATFGFLHLSAGIESVLQENFKSIRACMRMVESLERQDSVTLASLVGGEVSSAELTAFDTEFLGALGEAEGNVTEAEEKPVVQAISEGFASYRSARDGLLAVAADRTPTEYNASVLPGFIALKRAILELVEINQQAMVEADREARESALNSAIWLGILVGIALLSLIAMSRALQRHFLSRLVRLERAMIGIAEGEEGRRLRETGRDELTVMARQFNRLLDRRQELAAASDGRVAQERRTLLGLLSGVGHEAALYNLSGNLQASAGAELHAIPEVANWIAGEGRESIARWEEHPEGSLPEGQVGLPAGGHARIRLLGGGQGSVRPVGWLVERFPG